jgi:hypothetical protein
MESLQQRVNFLRCGLSSLVKEWGETDPNLFTEFERLQGHLAVIDTKPYKIGIVGAVSSGKSTLLNVICSRRWCNNRSSNRYHSWW